MRGLLQLLLSSTLTLLLTAGGEVAFAQSGLSAPGVVQPDTVYGRVGNWFVLRDLDGETVRLEDLSGRILFVNFWATWCAPCIEEMPTIVGLADSLDHSDVAFLLISIDDDERDVRRFVQKNDLPVPVYLRAWEPGESTFTAGLIPATFVVSREGAIVYQHHGAANWNTEPVRRFLTGLALEE